jgi:hypothetical protein
MSSILAASPRPASDTPAAAVRSSGLRAAFWLLLFGLIGLGLFRSWYTTRWDGFTIDEAWHVTAGVSYVRTGDYRLNPEHPPLVKLWAGASLPESAFTLPPFRPLLDKEGEREFINDAVYIASDPELVLSRVRVAMLAFHGLLLVALGYTLRRLAGATLSLCTLALLLLDPTVSANLPLVMTDLPLALTGALAMLQALIAFRSRRPLDLALAALALGLALATKHSGIIAAVAVGALAAVSVAQAWRAEGARRGLGLVGSALLVGAGALVVLWAFYRFRFEEGAATAGEALFNRSMEGKIIDLGSALHRRVIQTCNELRLLPRAYLWGLADILRVGMEGRQETLYVFGQRVEGTTPWYFFPAAMSVKLPLGLSALFLAGSVALVRRRVPREWLAPLAALGGWGALFLVVLMRGNSGYAGVRHALPALVFIAALAAAPVALAFASRVRWQLAAVGAALGAALASAGFVMRPWEYYNELVGGPDAAWRYFTDDGLDIRQRTRELAWYYDANLRGRGGKVYEFYEISDQERQAYRLDFHSVEDDPEDSSVVDGTVFMNARWLAQRPVYDYAAFRQAEPVARFGNLWVYRGRFEIPWVPAARRVSVAWDALSEDPPDVARADALLEQAVQLYPEDFGTAIDLGNLRIEHGAAQGARLAFERSRAYAPVNDPIVQALSEQIDLLARGDLASAHPVRNPWLE